MNYSLTAALCIINGAKIASRLYSFLEENDSGCFHDDEDMLRIFNDWQAKTPAELANYVNEMMIAKAEAYFESCLVDIKNQAHIKQILNFETNLNQQRPELGDFNITFNGYVYHNPDKESLNIIAEQIRNYETLINASVFPSTYFTIFVGGIVIEKLRAIDESIVEFSYPLVKETKSYIFFLPDNDNREKVIDELAKHDEKWASEIRFRFPSFIILADNKNGTLANY